jgi:hypothetical protein
VREKATHSDKSVVPFYLWNDRVIEQLNEHWTSRGMEPAFDSNDRLEQLRAIRALRLLRGATIRYWKRRVHTCFNTWFEKKGCLLQEHEEIKCAGEAAVAKAGEAT